jgi:hypothetical protein
MPIDLNNLDQYGLFKKFWKEHGDPDLAGGGLNEITPQGAQKLFEYALRHELDGTESRPDGRIIGNDEKELIKALLEHDHYGAFFEQDGRVKLLELFGLQAQDIQHADRVKPKDMGELPLLGRQSKTSESRLANTDPRSLGDLFAQEYKARRAEFEGGNGSVQDKGVKVLSLLRDYAAALWARGETPYTEQAGHALLDAFEKCRFANVVGGTNYNGAPWGAAQSMVLGLDPNAFGTHFPEAGSNVETTYLSMSDKMAKPMSFVDKYREAMGREKGAEAHELRSPLGFMIGEPNGHFKRGSLDEKKPFSSSGLNFGVVLFPGDKQIKDLPPKAGFEFPIDCLDGIGNFLRCDPKYGEQLKVIDPATGKFLNVEKVVHEEGGKPVSWSARFTDAEGKEVAADKALGVFVDRRGTIKGDKKAAKSVDMWWWGFCDRNTAQRLYKAKFGVPQVDQDAVKVKARGQVLEFPKDMAQQLLDADIPDIVTKQTMCGFRFNDEPQQISLKSGESFTGKVAGNVFESAAAVQRLSGDVVAVYNDEKRPLLGTITLETDGGGSETFNVKNVKSIERDEATGKVTVHVDGGWRHEYTGTLKSEVDFGQAPLQDGKRVLTQDETFPIRGELSVELANGQTRSVPAKAVNQVVGEMQNDLRISQFVTWVSQNKGMYATDSSTGPVVSNGMRWTNEIEQDVRHADDRPDWAPQGDLRGVEGGLERQAGDKLVWIRGRYGNEGGPANSSAFEGWVQVSKHGRVLNEGFTKGEPDFGWSADGKLNWLAQSSFNPYMEPELRLALLVNGVKDLKADTENTAAIAERLNLPANWRTYRAE